jgi:DNA-binding CsgD family transcriptional regulator
MTDAALEPLARAALLLGERSDGDGLNIVEAYTELCMQRLRVSGDSAETAAALARLLCDLQELALEQTEERLAAAARRIARCERGLGRLRTVTSPAALVDRVCEEVVASCGLERVLLSRVEGNVWRPWKVNDVVRDQPWFAEWVHREIPLDDLVLEARLLGERRAGLVTDTSNPSVHPMIRAGGSDSYVVAPIVPAGRVVGFIHADHGLGGRACDEIDRSVLWAFSEGFGHLYERSALLERLRFQRDRVRQTLTVADAALEQLTESEIELAMRPDDDAAVTRTALTVFRTEGGLDELTAREREILELIAGGASNKEIADSLVIAVGTVKTHVKHILAKLGAANRSQAIAVYLGVAVD